VIQRGPYLILVSDSSVVALAASIPTQPMVQLPQVPGFTFGGLVQGGCRQMERCVSPMRGGPGPAVWPQTWGNYFREISRETDFSRLDRAGERLKFVPAPQWIGLITATVLQLLSSYPASLAWIWNYHANRTHSIPLLSGYLSRIITQLYQDYSMRPSSTIGLSLQSISSYMNLKRISNWWKRVVFS
jgi:hypothetical protein